MDILLGKVTQQAMNYAIRSGIAITASYAISQSSRLLKNVEGTEREELQTLQERLESKIRIISPAIDMIELISARGNTSLESAISLTKSLRWDIQALGQRLANAANQENLAQRRSPKAQSKLQNELELKGIVNQIRSLLSCIEDAVPLINLAITTSGASLTTTLPATISPSRLLQASTFLTAGDTQYSMSSSKAVQIGPAFILSLYMLFSGHLRPQNEEDIMQSTWKEVIHKARVKLVRVPLGAIYNLPDQETRLDFGKSIQSLSGLNGNSIMAEGKADEFAYQLLIVEDLEDGRVHDHEEEDVKPSPYDDVDFPGIREALPIHEISKIFYADTGKILNIGGDGEANSPVLLLKRDTNAIPPRRMMERHGEGLNDDKQYMGNHTDKSPRGSNLDNNQSEIDAEFQRESRSPLAISECSLEPIANSERFRFPPGLDPEWLAFEVYTDAPESDTESEGDHDASKLYRSASLDPHMTSALINLNLNTPSPSTTSHFQQLIPPITPTITAPISTLPPIRTSLSLLETLLRLLSLQQFQQTSHLSIPDEFLNFFLSESATTGAAHGDEQERRRLRTDARRRVGFDPYDESPIKRRGEDYQYRGGTSQGGWNNAAADDNASQPVYVAYSPAARERSLDGYGSPARYDEGYDTRHLPLSSSPRRERALDARSRGMLETPPPILKNRSYSERGGTPSPGEMRAPGGLGRTGQIRVGEDGDRGVRRGSPLARPVAGATDEGIGSSLVVESVEKVEG